MIWIATATLMAVFSVPIYDDIDELDLVQPTATLAVRVWRRPLARLRLADNVLPNTMNAPTN